MQRLRLWTVCDHIAHFLYRPIMFGGRSARARWFDNIHLIPSRWHTWICDRYDLALGMTRDELDRAK